MRGDEFDEFRARSFSGFYDYRHRGLVQLADVLAAVYPAETLLVVRVSEQLAQARMVEWKTSKSIAAVDGIGRITATGVNVAEDQREPSIRLSHWATAEFRAEASAKRPFCDKIGSGRQGAGSDR